MSLKVVYLKPYKHHSIIHLVKCLHKMPLNQRGPKAQNQGEYRLCSQFLVTGNSREYKEALAEDKINPFYHPWHINRYFAHPTYTSFLSQHLEPTNYVKDNAYIKKTTYTEIIIGYTQPDCQYIQSKILPSPVQQMARTKWPSKTCFVFSNSSETLYTIAVSGWVHHVWRLRESMLLCSLNLSTQCNIVLPHKEYESLKYKFPTTEINTIQISNSTLMREREDLISII